MNDGGKEHNRAFGAALRRLRQSTRQTQESLAFECGLDRTYISLLELGARSPTLDTLVALSKGLGISLSELMVAVEHEMAVGQDET